MKLCSTPLAHRFYVDEHLVYVDVADQNEDHFEGDDDVANDCVVKCEVGVDLWWRKLMLYSDRDRRESGRKLSLKH